MKKKLAGFKINISILGYGHIGRDLVAGIIKYNEKNPDDIIVINNILVKDKVKNLDENYNFTDDPLDILTNKSDLVVDLMDNIEYSLEYLPQLFAAKKSVLLAGKIFLSEHGEFLFKQAKANDAQILIGSCISSDMPIHISTKNPYYNGEEYKVKRGNNSAEVSSAILEDIFYFYS